MVACPRRRTLIMAFLLPTCRHGRACPGHPRPHLYPPPQAGEGWEGDKTWMPGTRPGMTECITLPADLVLPRRDLELADGVALAAQHVAGLDRADAVRRAGKIHVPRVERIERRREFDQPAAIVDQVLGVGALAQLAVAV